jgi:hypothetical protein
MIADVFLFSFLEENCAGYERLGEALGRIHLLLPAAPVLCNFESGRLKYPTPGMQLCGLHDDMPAHICVGTVFHSARSSSICVASSIKS